jgi:predicted AAA+ superfamily ATPase
MVMVKRILRLDLPEGQSAFLWGPRKTGKTTYLRSEFPNSIVYDFLKSDLYLELLKRPALLSEQLLTRDEKTLKNPIILDEVQKIPHILDEVHWLIENRKINFILSGSSARKLKRGRANLLGGRAWRYELLPLVSSELKTWDLLSVLNRGLIPDHYFKNNYRKSLQAYTRDYLKEEVFAEGLTRNIPAFSRFFEAMGYSHGEMVNYSNIARDCGVNSTTVREYYNILVDTLIGRMVIPYKKRQNRQVITKSPKFYLFDTGVAGAITKRSIMEEKGEEFGKALEHFIFMELTAYNAYMDIDFEVNYWRTKSGLEVDFILGGGEVAIEVKGSDYVARKDFHAITAFRDEYNPGKAIIVCNENDERIYKQIRILPYRKFLTELWEGKIIR